MPPGRGGEREPHRLRRGAGAEADAAQPRAGGALLNLDDLVWYAAYGSNLDADRFRCYLHGGCPPGATRTYPGVREPADPLDVRPFRMVGELVFAWQSPTWGGGIAFHDADAPGQVYAQAYLLTVRQFTDVVEQEMRRSPGADHDLAPLVVSGRQTLGPGRYESLRVVDTWAGRPVVTIGCADPRALGLGAPAAAYVATVARGLRAAHGLTAGEIADYLVRCPGVAAGWTVTELDAVVSHV